MKYSFKSDDCMVITIPIQSIRNAADGQLLPENFTCVFKDMYKVFLRGRPKAMGAAQMTTGVFIMCLGAVFITKFGIEHARHIAPSVLFVACGILTYAAGHTPVMPVMKMSFVFNVVALFWAIAAIILCPVTEGSPYSSPNTKEKMYVGLKAVLIVLNLLEFFLAAVMIFWESKAVCRAHFNTLPMITLKQDQ
ncbi:membrane-spanning 4-domains subfamily A member 4D [Hoplias malabaricus]|uniref:membrane-spanning 4-domains subfamily A member 4D n=1 Tax=Hoplias malabaricus TaxID=27720 RepID=UPI00346228A3